VESLYGGQEVSWLGLGLGASLLAFTSQHRLCLLLESVYHVGTAGTMNPLALALVSLVSSLN
jgi:hypothetical protein